VSAFEPLELTEMEFFFEYSKADLLKPTTDFAAFDQGRMYTTIRRIRIITCCTSIQSTVYLQIGNEKNTEDSFF